MHQACGLLVTPHFFTMVLRNNMGSLWCEDLSLGLQNCSEIENVFPTFFSKQCTSFFNVYFPAILDHTVTFSNLCK
jgi:hypothetical protein